MWGRNPGWGSNDGARQCGLSHANFKRPAHHRAKNSKSREHSESQVSILCNFKEHFHGCWFQNSHEWGLSQWLPNPIVQHIHTQSLYFYLFGNSSECILISIRDNQRKSGPAHLHHGFFFFFFGKLHGLLLVSNWDFNVLLSEYLMWHIFELTAVRMG